MITKHIYICEDSIDGIFTGIYDAWASRYGHENNRIVIDEPMNLTLFSEYFKVETDHDKARSVADSIKRKISDTAYDMICHSALSKDRDKADSIYRFMILGYAMGGRVIDYLSHPAVNHVFCMDRNLNFEVMHYRGFLRFSQLKNGVLVSGIRPANDITEILAPHFQDRLTDENWLIYDEDRKKAAVHQAGYSWIMTDASDLNKEHFTDYSDQELMMQELWKHFVDTIGIEARKNDKLRLSMMPNRYREFMREVPYKAR